MKGQILKILFKDNSAFLIEEAALDFNQVKISYSHLPVKFKRPAFWTVRVITHIENENRLFVEVISYHVGETQFSSSQLKLKDRLMSVKKITFKSIDTGGLLRTLNGKEPENILAPKPKTIYRETTIETKPIEETYNEPFLISIKNVTFSAGKVVFEKKIQHFKKSIEFQIPNEYIIKEYDAIKNYFASVLNTKKAHVVPTITAVNNRIISVTAYCSEIEKIDKSFIEEVKFELVKGVKKKESIRDKQLFTVEEYLDTYADLNFKELGFFKNDGDFFESSLEKSKTKHYKQLRFLSSRHQHNILKLRIVHDPFSYVFLLSGTGKYHIVWETLDTQEATYIWTTANDKTSLRQAISQIDTTIGEINKTGKSEYINRREENFIRVFHDYTDLQNGFKNWKADIEKIIS